MKKTSCLEKVRVGDVVAPLRMPQEGLKGRFTTFTMNCPSCPARASITGNNFETILDESGKAVLSCTVVAIIFYGPCRGN